MDIDSVGRANKSERATKTSGRRGAVLLAGATVFVLAVSACSSSGSKAADSSTPAAGATTSSSSTGSASGSTADIPAGPMTLCVSVSLGGLTATQGQQNSYKAAADIVNQKYGGIAGHPISFTLVNDQGKANIAIENMNKFVADHKKNPNTCIAETGMDYDPSIQPNMVAIANKAKMITILDSSVDAYSDPTQYPYLFPISPSDKSVGMAMGKYMASKGFKKWAVLTDGIPQEVEQINDDLAGAKAAGLDASIIKTATIAIGAVNVQTQLTELQQSNPDVLLVMLGLGYGPVWSGLNTLGWNVPVVGDLAAFYFSTANLGRVAANAVSPAWWGQIPNHPDLPQNIVDVMNAIGPNVGAPHYPGLLISASVEMSKALLIKYAVEKSNSVDPDKMKAALETMSDTPIYWPGARFTYSATEHTSLVGPYSAGAMRMDKFATNGTFIYSTPDGSPLASPESLAALDSKDPVFPDK
jgi:ABC-type branched-subunit amino acid transport system substrate-binding protein